MKFDSDICLQVYLKNVDLYGGAPRYTYRIELRFKGHEFVIGPRSSATVDGKAVRVFSFHFITFSLPRGTLKISFFAIDFSMSKSYCGVPVYD